MLYSIKIGSENDLWQCKVNSDGVQESSHSGDESSEQSKTCENGQMLPEILNKHS